MTSIGDLIAKWTARGAGWRDDGGALVPGEAIARQIVADLQAVDQSYTNEPVTLREAAMFGGYSYAHLQRLVADKVIPDIGRKGSPRIRRADVPIKAGHGLREPAGADQLSARRQIVASVVTKRSA